MNVDEMLTKARSASKSLIYLSDDEINATLLGVADALMDNTEAILTANSADLGRMDPADPKYDRLRLTAERIAAIADDTRAVAALPSPRRVIDTRVRPNGLRITRVAVPFGVIGVIYEARPNVTADVFSLCLKSCNACVLKGGHDAADSCRAIADVIRHVLSDRGINPDVLTLLPPTREATAQLLKARGVVDLIIPRGSASLIRSVREQSEIPVIETGAGVCHCYVESTADIDMAAKIVNNAKTRRVSVCNALDCLLVDRSLLSQLPLICAPLAASRVLIHADAPSYTALSQTNSQPSSTGFQPVTPQPVAQQPVSPRPVYPRDLLVHADEADYGTEFLSYQMAIRIVDGIDDALAHIDRYGSGHSEAIVTADAEAAKRFQSEVDAACVYVNAPTSFTDGAQFGLGAEIGISTQKLHARGPMALCELMTYKWLIDGDGQTRQ